MTSPWGRCRSFFVECKEYRPMMASASDRAERKFRLRSRAGQAGWLLATQRFRRIDARCAADGDPAREERGSQ